MWVTKKRHGWMLNFPESSSLHISAKIIIARPRPSDRDDKKKKDGWPPLFQRRLSKKLDPSKKKLSFYRDQQFPLRNTRTHHVSIHDYSRHLLPFLNGDIDLRNPRSKQISTIRRDHLPRTISRRRPTTTHLIIILFLHNQNPIFPPENPSIFPLILLPSNQPIHRLPIRRRFLKHQHPRRFHGNPLWILRLPNRHLHRAQLPHQQQRQRAIERIRSPQRHLRLGHVRDVFPQGRTGHAPGCVSVGDDDGDTGSEDGVE